MGLHELPPLDDDELVLVVLLLVELVLLLVDEVPPVPPADDELELVDVDTEPPAPDEDEPAVLDDDPVVSELAALGALPHPAAAAASAKNSDSARGAVDEGFDMGAAGSRCRDRAGAAARDRRGAVRSAGSQLGSRGSLPGAEGDTIPTLRLAKLSFCCVPLVVLLGACSQSGPKPTPIASAAPSSAPATSASAAPDATSALVDRDADHVGGVIARVSGGDGVLIADEDHALVRYVADTSPLLHPDPKALPDAGKAPAKPGAVVAQETLSLGGAPANLVAIRDGALVTVRDPGKLVRVRRGADGKLSVAHELAVAADAWGIALNDAGTRALVTSAWTSTVTVVEIGDAGLKKCAEVSVGREPRGVVFASDTVAYVNHLVGDEITRISLRPGCGADSIAEAKRVVVPPSPVRSPAGKVLPASLGYALALSPDGKRLFVPRHALGARSHASWFGAATVDVLLLPAEVPAAPAYAPGLPGLSSTKLDNYGEKVEYDNQPVEAWSAFVQPRDIRYRRATGTVIVVSEGADRLVELDAMAMDPAYAIAGLYELSDSVRRSHSKGPPLRSGHWPSGPRRDAYTDPSDANASDDASCAAPQGVVLSAREDAAFVFCRASTTLARVELGKSLDSGADNTKGLRFASLGADAGGKESLNLGRRLFYSSTMAEGMGCAGCHPEGRDDGHVWRETERPDKATRFLGGPDIRGPAAEPSGAPRRTPMLVGRVLPVGPYGWRAESETLEARILAGTQLHAGDHPHEVPIHYVNAVAVFLRKGLVAPPAHAEGLTPEEQKGKALFADGKTRCAGCHEPGRYFSNYLAVKLASLPTLPGFAPEEGAEYKTPSLLHVGHHGSLFHDGSASTLEELIEKNGTRMGDTAHLTADERKALVAYLKTL